MGDGEGFAAGLSLGMMGTQGLEEEVFGEGITSKRLLSVGGSNSKTASLPWENKDFSTLST